MWVHSEGFARYLSAAAQHLPNLENSWVLDHPDRVRFLGLEMLKGFDGEKMMATLLNIDASAGGTRFKLPDVSPKEGPKKMDMADVHRETSNFAKHFGRKMHKLMASEPTFFVSHTVKESDGRLWYFLRLPIDDWLDEELQAQEDVQFLAAAAERFPGLAQWLRTSSTALGWAKKTRHAVMPRWRWWIRTLPNLLSLVRVPLGVIVATLVFQGRYDWALGVYTAGMVSDVADGFLARHFESSTDLGRELDRVCDIIFNFGSGAALVGAALFRGHVGDLLIVALLLAGYLGSYVLWQKPSAEGAGVQSLLPKHSVMAAYRSGLVRVVLVLVMLLHASWISWVAQLALLFFWIPVIGYERERLEKEANDKSGKRIRVIQPKEADKRHSSKKQKPSEED